MNSHEVATLVGVALRGAGDALLMYAQVEERQEDGPCQHPEDCRQPEPVSGSPREFLCTACGELVNPDEVSDASTE